METIIPVQVAGWPGPALAVNQYQQDGQRLVVVVRLDESDRTVWAVPAEQVTTLQGQPIPARAWRAASADNPLAGGDGM